VQCRIAQFVQSSDMINTGQPLFRIGGTLAYTRRNIAGKRHTMPFQEFVRSHNEDGTHETTCMECLATVATVGSETELYQHELVHVCDPVNLNRMNRDRAAQPFL